MPIDEIRELLVNRKDKEESLLHYLELQRSFMYSRWVELSKVIQTTEAMIDRVRKERVIDPASLYELAEANKRLRQARDNWVDRWNFNQLADSFDDMVSSKQSGPFESYEKVLAEVVAAADPKPGETGLDAGTGTGNLASRFVARKIQMSGFDQSPEMLKQCRRKHPDMETKLGTFFAFPFLDHEFDFVATSYALHHLTDEQKQLALAECKRVLKPKGRLIIADLMFENESHRLRHMQMLRKAGETETIQQIENKCYADRSRMLEELASLGFVAHARQLTTYVHLISAKLA